MDDKAYLQRLIKEGEHQQQDFKYRVSDALKLAKSVSAFANTDGGRLLIGVRDDGYMSGVRSEEEIYMMHQAAYRYCRPEASIKFDTYHVEGRTIVVATVPPSGRRPICVVDKEDKPRAYIRIADENIVASPVHLAIWREAQNPQGVMMTYTETVSKLLAAMEGQRLTLNQIVKRNKRNCPDGQIAFIPDFRNGDGFGVRSFRKRVFERSAAVSYSLRADILRAVNVPERDIIKTVKHRCLYAVRTADRNIFGIRSRSADNELMRNEDVSVFIRNIHVFYRNTHGVGI